MTHWRNGSTRRWRMLRAYLLARSDICHICGKPGADTIDHLISPLDGGAIYDLANLRPAHGKKRDGCIGNYGRGRAFRQTSAPSRDW